MTTRANKALLAIGVFGVAWYVLRVPLIPKGGGVYLSLVVVCLLMLRSISWRPNGFNRYAILLLDSAFACALIILTANLAMEVIYRINWNFGFFFEPSAVTTVEPRELLKSLYFGNFPKIYTRMTDYPYFITLYPPLFYFFVKLSTLALGPNLIAARIISVASFFILLGIVGVIVRRLTQSLWLSVLAVAAILSTTQVTNWSVVGRPDILAWMLAFGSMLILLPVGDRELSKKRLVSAALIISMAMLTKEQTFPFFGGCLVYTFWKCSVKNVIYCYVLPTLMIVGGVYLTLNFVTSGAFFLNVIVYPYTLAHNIEFNKFDTFFRNSKSFLLTMYSLVIVFLVYAFYRLYKFKFDLVVIIFLINLPFHYMLLRSWGHDTNYDTCSVILLIIGVMCFVALFKGTKLYLGVGAFVFSLIMIPYSDYSGLTSLSAYNLYLPTPNDHITNHRLNNMVISNVYNRSKGIGLVDAESSYLILPYDKGTVKYIDATESDVYAKVGGWIPGQSKVVQDILYGRFAFLLLTKSIPLVIKEAVGHTYTPILDIENSILYLIKSN